MYRIKDKTNDKYFGGIIANVYGSKQEVIEQLITFHSVDFDDEVYGNDIWSYLNMFETEEAQLQAILQYGDWEIEEVKGV